MRAPATVDRMRLALEYLRTHAVLKAFIACRVILIVVSFVIAGWKSVSPLALWRQWDGWWYLNIAERGYGWAYHGHSALAFFPLLPLAVHLVALTGIPTVVAGLGVTNAAFLAALFYLHALAASRLGAAFADRVVWLYSLFPMTFFTFAPYTESLFLLAALGATYHARNGETVRAGLWIAFAVVTRSTAVILYIPVLVLLWQHYRGRPHWDAARGHGRSAHRSIPVQLPTHSACYRDAIWVAAWLVTPSMLALGSYVLYLRSHAFSVSAVMRAQESWHRSLTWPWTGFVQSVVWPFEHPHALWPSFAETVISLSVTVVSLGLTVRAWSHLDLAERLYLLGFWALVLCTPEWRDDYYAPFSSLDRFVLVLFPLAWWAAIRLPERATRLVLGTQAAALAIVTAAFLSAAWIG